MSTSVSPEVRAIEARLDLLTEQVVFIMNSVMIPRKIGGIVTPDNPTGQKTALIPLGVMWNALEEVKQRLQSEKSELQAQSGVKNG